MQVPLEVLLGPAGALALALLWIYDLRQQNGKLRDELKGITDDLRRAIARADPK